MTKPLVFVDLDDTLFQTWSKCPESELPHLQQCAEAANGRHSYSTRQQFALFAWLAASTELVPVTARGTEAYSRVSLPFGEGAVLANGAVVLLPGGGIDLEWREAVAGGLAGAQPTMRHLLERGRVLASAMGLDLRSWLVEEAGSFAYVVFKDNVDDRGAGLTILAGALEVPEGWNRHRNGNNLTYIPPCISKRLACERLIARARAADPTQPVLGFGDSIGDLAFMYLCDFMATPSRGQIAELIRAASA